MIKLSNLLEKMRCNNRNYLEYYNQGIKIKKTYTEVYGDVLKTLSLLNELGLQRGHKVGIMCNNKYEWILVDLACLFGGYILVAIHTKDFQSKLEYLVSELNINIIFIERKIKNELNVKLNLFEIDSLTEQIKAKEKAVPGDFTFKEDDIFTIVFTSGTTGISKGIGLRIKAIEHTITVTSNQFNYTNNDKILTFLPLSVFTSRLYIYGAFILDSNLITTVPEMALSALRIYKPTIMQSVPYFFESICNIFFQKINYSILSVSAYKLYDFLGEIMPPVIRKKLHQKLFGEVINYFGGNMRIMITGTAPISRKVLEFFKKTGMVLYESYGLNETGVLTLNSPNDSKIGSVGKLLDGYSIFFDDENQILVKSEYFWSNGYIKADDGVNKEVFRKDGIIATGDIGWIDEDGFLFLNGRISDVISLTSGQKVHPIVVEKHLNSSLLIKQSMVTGNNKPYLVAIIVKNNKDIKNKQIREEIKKQNRDLPEHQMIKDFVAIDEAFSFQNGQLSNNLKLNRAEIYKKYKKEIDSLYD
jgi:long-chain acyl-CoA synthetase